MNRRKQELSIMNVIFCLAVIFIHILSYPITAFSPGTMKFTFFMLPSRMISIVVQGFIFLAGVKLFLAKKEEMRYTDYLKGRFKAILWPYLICCTVYCICYSFLYSYAVTLEYFIDNILTGSLAAHFYFIPLLVQFDILLPLWKKIVDKCSPIFVIPAAVLASNFFETSMPGIFNAITSDGVNIYNDRLFTTYIAFWIAGCYVGRNYDRFCALVKKNFKFMVGFFGVMFAVCAFSSYLTFNDFFKVPGMNSIHYCYTLSAILFLFAVSQRLPDGKTSGARLFNFIDKQSYSIYLWHMLVIIMSDFLVRDFGLAMQSLAFIFRVLFVYTFTIIGVKILQFLRSKLNRIPAAASVPSNKQLIFKVRYTKRAGH